MNVVVSGWVCGDLEGERPENRYAVEIMNEGHGYTVHVNFGVSLSLALTREALLVSLT